MVRSKNINFIVRDNEIYVQSKLGFIMLVKDKNEQLMIKEIIKSLEKAEQRFIKKFNEQEKDEYDYDKR